MSKFVPYPQIAHSQPLSMGMIPDALMQVHDAIAAFNLMNQMMMASGEGQPEHIQIGAQALLGAQLSILQSITNEVQLWSEERRETAQREAAEAAEAQEPGEFGRAITKLRETFISEGARAGADTRVIAGALNMRRATIERVIGQLRGSAPSAPEALRAASA